MYYNHISVAFISVHSSDDALLLCAVLSIYFYNMMKGEEEEEEENASLVRLSSDHIPTRTLCPVNLFLFHFIFGSGV